MPGVRCPDASEMAGSRIDGRAAYSVLQQQGTNSFSGKSRRVQNPHTIKRVEFFAHLLSNLYNIIKPHAAVYTRHKPLFDHHEKNSTGNSAACLTGCLTGR